MTYYKTGTKGTVALSWSPKFLLYYPDQIIGREFGPRAWENKTSFINVGAGPRTGGTLQYRVYGCAPMDYQTLMRGRLIVPGHRWSSVRNALQIPSNRGGFIAIVAFFLPTEADRKRGLRPTYSLISGSTETGVRMVLAPSPCPINLKRPDGSCSCAPTICGGIPPMCPSSTHPKSCTSKNEYLGVSWRYTPCTENTFVWQQFFKPGEL